MSFNSDRSQDNSYRIGKTAHGQASVWGSSSQQISTAARKGLAPLSISSTAPQQPPSPSPARNTFGAPPTNSSRHSSVSSSSSVLSPTASGPTYQSRFGKTSPHLGSSAFDRNAPSRFSRQNSAVASSASSPTGQLTSLVVTQLNILLSTLKEDKDKAKWETQVDKIWKLIDEHGMEVFSQYFRRLLHSNAAQVFSAAAPSADSNAGTYQLLANEMRKLATDEHQPAKIAAALDYSDGDLYKDFDLAALAQHFKLDPFAVSALSLACKNAVKQDLKMKADAMLSESLEPLLNLLPDTSDGPDTPTPEFLAALIDGLLHSPPQNWTQQIESRLQFATRARYDRHKCIPYPIGAMLFMTDCLTAPNSLLRAIRRDGFRATETVESCRSLLSQISPVSNPHIAECLLYMAITAVKYNLSTFVTALRDSVQDWHDIVQCFDEPELRVTKQQFLALFNALLPVAKDDPSFDIQSLWGVPPERQNQQTGSTWNNPQTQLSFVVAFLSSTAEELDVTQIPGFRYAFTTQEFAQTSDRVREYAAKAAKHPMVSQDATHALFTIIFSSQDAYNAAQALGIPEAVINANTDIFVCAASAVQKPWVALQEQALRQLLYPFFLKTLPNHGFVMHALWIHDSSWLAGRLIEFYNGNQTLLTMTYEHAKELDWIDQLVSVRNDFGLDFTALAHSHGHIEIETWAAEHIQNSGVPAGELSRAIINFLRFKVEDELLVQREGENPSTTSLQVKSVFAFLNVIQGTVTEHEESAIQRSCIQAYPRVINYGYKYDSVIDGLGADGNALSQEADAKMQEQYKNMYGGDADARKMINTLRDLKESETPEDQEFFASMIGGLFEEYNCFGEYPLEALATTAVLFGGIINFGILHSRITLSVALCMVVDAVTESPPEDSMYKFGLQALLHFVKRLEEWPQLCERLCRIPGLRGTDVFARAEEVVRNQPRDETKSESEPETSYQPFTSIKADALDQPAEVPIEDTSDKVMFVLNNITKRNLDEKFKELNSALESRHYQWFAQYLVGDLVKLQPNHQSLYLSVLDLFNTKALRVEVLRETYECIQRIMNSEATLSSTVDRNNLKNLAGWLGLNTLARNLPILHRNISFRDLLVEAHQTQRLLIAIPFTCKVLAQAAQSTTFKPPNPWIMELVGLLMELYHFAELKLNLKFEIEVLCTELGLDHKTLEPAEIIRAIPLATDESYIQPFPHESVDGFGDMLGLGKRANERISAAEIMESLPDLASILVLPPPPGNASSQAFKTVFLTAVQQAIQEIIGPVADRSVTIAAISTYQLIEKDFATEPDSERLQHSAYTMVKALAGSLALVTCKEPLRSAMSNNLRLLASEHLQEPLPEGSILMFLNDNLETVCKLVEDAAESYSMAEADAHMEQAVESRRRYAQQRTGQPFNEPPVSKWAFAIPDPYRQSVKGLNSHQLAIYEDFGRHARVSPAHAPQPSHDTTRQLSDVLSDNYLPGFPGYADAAGQRVQSRMQTPPVMQQGHGHVNGNADGPNVLERVHKLLSELQRVAREAPEEHIRDLGPVAPTREVFEQLIRVISASVQKDSLAIAAGQHATLLVYSEAKSRLEVEVLVQFLNQLCSMSVPTARQLIMYLSTIEDDRLFNASVTACLLKTCLIDVHHVDLQIAKAINQRRTVALQVLATLFEEVMLAEPQSGAPEIMRADFVLALGELSQWSREDPSNELAKQLLDTCHDHAVDEHTPPDNRHDQMDYVFQEWIQLQRPDAPERAWVAFINQLHSSRLIADHDDFALLLRVCIDSSVESYKREEAIPLGSLDHAYVKVDALAKLIAFLVSYHGDQSETGHAKTIKIKYLEHVLCFIVLVMNHHYHTHAEHFNSKVFFRLFSSLMIELHAVRAHFGEALTEVSVVIGQALLTMQPQIFPGFSFAWLSLVGHRTFIATVMRSANNKGRHVYVDLLCVLNTYLGDLVQSSSQTTIVQDYYRATLRMLCMLQHDYPDFVAENFLKLNSSVPLTMVQLHNVINCANPSTLEEMPDPFTPGLKITRLEQIRQLPAYEDIEVQQLLNKAGIKDAVDYARTATVSKDLGDLIGAILTGLETPTPALTAACSTTSARGLVINALITYLVSTDTADSQLAFSSYASSARFLLSLVEQAKPETRYRLIFAMANQIRYPNAFTYYYSTAFMHLFSVGSESVQQSLARVLVERLMVAHPHPWGLIVTILELIKNKSYDVFEQGWMKAAPEIEKMLLSILQTQDLRAASGGAGAGAGAGPGPVTPAGGAGIAAGAGVVAGAGAVGGAR